MSEVRWGHPDQWQGRDAAAREEALRTENLRLRQALRHIAGQGTGRWGGSYHVDNFGEPWMHWAERASAALDEKDQRDLLIERARREVPALRAKAAKNLADLRRIANG